jgi:DMSO/TMAO reductase YedYZ heme-binding membrane subunit
LGVVALYLLVAIEITSWLKRRLPRRLWHTVHLGSLPLFVFASVHGFAAGADNRNLLVQWIALTGSLMVLFLLLFRILAPRRARRPRPSARVEQPVVA